MRILSYTIFLFTVMTIISVLSFFYVLLFNFMQIPSMRAHRHTFQTFINSSKSYFQISPENIKLDINQKFSTDFEFNKRTLTHDNQNMDPKINDFKNHLIVKLRRSESDLSSYLLRQQNLQNLYNVKFTGRKSSQHPSRSSLCNIPVILFKNIKKHFHSDSNTEKDIFESFSIDEVFPSKDNNKMRPICAMVSNSGALIGSHFGEEIDSHDIVLRFNNAPTIGYSEDVGNKTNIRVLNSQLILNDSFNVSFSDLYRNAVKFVWDASDYDLDLIKWIHKRQQFFQAHQKLIQVFPNETFAIIHPEIIWKSWDLLQSTTFTSIPKNPPSSGFLGIVILLKMCSKVDIYEYIPSIRMSDRCHYYDTTNNIGCTFGQWHPLSTEKLFILSINEANHYESVFNGKVSLNGCGF